MVRVFVDITCPSLKVGVILSVSVNQLSNNPAKVTHDFQIILSVICSHSLPTAKVLVEEPFKLTSLVHNQFKNIEILLLQKLHIVILAL